MGPCYDHNLGHTRHAVPPIGPDGAQPRLHMDAVVARRRQAQAEAFRAAPGVLARGLLAALGAVRRFVACAGAGAAKRAPDGLTTACR